MGLGKAADPQEVGVLGPQTLPRHLLPSGDMSTELWPWTSPGWWWGPHFGSHPPQQPPKRSLLSFH